MGRQAAVSSADRVTVVIATANRSDSLRRTLQRLAALEDAATVIVVDNGSTDDTPAMVRSEHPGVQLVALGHNLGAAARNVGVALATTPYVAFCDDDSWWEPGALAAVVDLMDGDPRIGLVAARILVGPARDIDPTSAQMAAGRLDQLRLEADGARGITGFLACGAAVRRSAFLASGGFEAHLMIGGEEELLSLDLAAGGWKLVYCPGAVVAHYPSPQRDLHGRRRLLVRNGLIVAGLRYSAPALRARAALILSRAARDRSARSGLGDALRSLLWTASRRRVVPSRVEQAFVGPDT